MHINPPGGFKIHLIKAVLHKERVICLLINFNC